MPDYFTLIHLNSLNVYPIFMQINTLTQIVKILSIQIIVLSSIKRPPSKHYIVRKRSGD